MINIGGELQNSIFPKCEVLRKCKKQNVYNLPKPFFSSFWLVHLADRGYDWGNNFFAGTRNTIRSSRKKQFSI